MRLHPFRRYDNQAALDGCPSDSREMDTQQQGAQFSLRPSKPLGLGNGRCDPRSPRKRDGHPLSAVPGSASGFSPRTEGKIGVEADLLVFRRPRADRRSIGARRATPPGDGLC